VLLLGCDDSGSQLADVELTEQQKQENLIAAYRELVRQNKEQERKSPKFSLNKFFSDRDVIALCKAAQDNNVAEIDRLVAKGVDVNTRGKGDLTPLILAIKAQSKEAFQAMLKHGANPNIIFASKPEILEKENLLVISPTSLGDCVTSIAASIEDDSEWLEMVLKHGGDANIHDPIASFGHNRPIYNAIASRNKKNVELLIKAGADINYQDDGQDTPLNHAATSRNYRIVLLLLKAVANWKVKDRYGKNLAYYYYVYSINEEDKVDFPVEYVYYQKVLKFLEQKGADLAIAKKKADAWRKIQLE